MIEKVRRRNKVPFVAFQPERMKALRLKRKLSLRKLADMMDLDWVTLQRYERGKIEPKVNRAAEIANILGTSTSYLCGEIDDPDMVLLISDLSQEEREMLLARKRGDLELLSRLAHKEITKNKPK